jgi:hypothetical protein
MAGALLFEWNDEWFKNAWNVSPRTLPVDGERRALWHDALNKEQWFGVLATDPVQSGWRTLYESRFNLLSYSVNTDPVFLTVKAKFSSKSTEEVFFGFDVIPGKGELLPGQTAGEATSDVAVKINPSTKTATAYIIHSLNPIYLDGLDPVDYQPNRMGNWDLQQQSLNRSWPEVNGYPSRPAEFYDIGKLTEGTWNPEAPEFNSEALWNIKGRTINLRLPWSMLSFADPSSHAALDIVSGTGTRLVTSGIQAVVVSNKVFFDVGNIGWDEWNSVEYSERLKNGTSFLSDAWKITSQ